MTPPGNPRKNEEILPWAQSITRFLRALTPRESADVAPQISSTGTTFRVKKRGGTTTGVGSFPFQVTPAAPPDGEDDDPTRPWVTVCRNSWVLATIDATSKITISGLDSPFQLTAQSQNYIWLAFDLTAESEDTGGNPTISVEHSTDDQQTWDSDDIKIFPKPVQYSTDDGTLLGSSGNPPANRTQTHFYVPIAYTIDPDNDDLNIAKDFGIPLISSDQAESSGGNAMTLMQVLNTHLLLAGNCAFGDGNLQYVMPWSGPMAKLSS